MRMAAHGHGLACARALADGSRLAHDAAGGGDLGDRTEQLDEVRDVVRAHVHDRAAALPDVVEVGIGMPTLVSGQHQEGGAAERLADAAGIDQRSCRLVRAAEERIGRAADPEPFGRGRLDQPAALGERNRQRLFEIDMLAGGDGVEGHRHVGLWDGEVEDDLDPRIGEERFDRNRRHAEFLAPRSGGRRVAVGQGEHLDLWKEGSSLEVGTADDPSTDDAHPDRPASCGVLVHRHAPLICCKRGPVVPQGAP